MHKYYHLLKSSFVLRQWRKINVYENRLKVALSNKIFIFKKVGFVLIVCNIFPIELLFITHEHLQQVVNMST